MSREARADAIVARMGPGEVRALAVAAVEVMLAEDVSLADLSHREFVHGVIHGSAPTFSQSIRHLIKIARKFRGRQPVSYRGTA